jgi:dTDP-4-amino-4,6-dideoxygalactose transaminase
MVNNESDIQHIIGNAHYKIGNYAEAIPYLEKYQTKAKPTRDDAYELGYAHYITKNYDKVLEELNNNQIDYRHFFYPLHKQPFLNLKEVIPNSEYSFENGILLPIFNKLTYNQIKLVTQIINNVTK